MKIVQLIMARQYRGAEISAHYLSRELVARGHDVLIISLYTYSTAKFIPDDVPYIDLQGARSSFLSLKLLRKLMRIISEFQPDIIQANAGDTLKYSVAAKVFSRHKFSLIFRNASTISQYIKNSLKRKIIGSLLRKIDYVVSVSDLSRKDITGLYPFLVNKIRVIPGGVNIQQRPVPERDQYQFIIGKSPVFIHVGGFTFEKNHTGLLRIFEQFRKRYSTGHLLLVGEGPLYAGVQAETVSMRLDQHVTFVGSRSDIPQLLTFSEALVLPSVIEGLPAVILEAFQYKVPVVAYSVGGIHEVVINGQTGWLVDKGDEHGFVTAMFDAVNSARKNILVSNAYKLVVDKYDQEKITEHFVQTYRALLKK